MPINKNKILVIGLFVSVISLCYIGVYNYKLTQKSEALTKQFADEKKILETQIDEILSQYDKIKSENDELKLEHRKITQKNIEKTLKKSANPNYVNDSSTKGKLHNLKVQNDEFQSKILKLEDEISKNNKKIARLESFSEIDKTKVKQLKAINVNARGVRVLSDLYQKSKVHSIQELRVCFTLEGSEFVDNGNKKIYIQIVNPNNQIVSVDKDVFSDSEGNKIIYSSKTDVAYNQKDTDVCAYVDLEKNKTIKGTYQINLFYNSAKIGSTSYQYN